MSNLISGKQIKNGSINIGGDNNKLNAAGDFNMGSFGLQSTKVAVNNSDLTNKAYVDALVNAVTTESTTAGNGLTMNGTTVELGGTLSQDTTIDGGSHLLTITNVEELYINANNYMTIGGGVNMVVSANEVKLYGDDSVNIESPDFFITDTTLQQRNFEVVDGNVRVYNLAGVGDRPIGVDSTGKLKTLSDTYGSNGITKTGNTFELGGTLTKNTTITTGSNTLTVAGSNGLRYATDISSNFTNRSLVDKQYVDTLVNAVTTESTTAGNGLTMNGTTVELGGQLTQDTSIISQNNDVTMSIGNIGFALNMSGAQFDASSSGINLNGTDLKIKGGSSSTNYINISTSALTQDRNISFQDKSGTVALNEDLISATSGLWSAINNLASIDTLKKPDTWSASSGLYPTTWYGQSIEAGDTWRITTAGNVGSKPVNVEDLLIALVDSPAQLDANFMIVESNRDQATETVKGVAEIATTAETTTGTNDTNIVTPLKLQQKIDTVNASLTTFGSNGITKTGNTFELGGTLNQNTTITTGSNTLTVAGSNGLRYATDISSNFTNRSLVDKQYVDTLVNAITTESTTAGNGLTMNGTTVELGGNLTKPTTIWGNKLDLVTPAYDLNDAGLYLHKNGNFFQANMANPNPSLTFNTVNSTFFSVYENQMTFNNGSAGDVNFNISNGGLTVDANQGMQFRAEQTQLYWNGSSGGAYFQVNGIGGDIFFSKNPNEYLAFNGGRLTISDGNLGGLQWNDSNSISSFSADNSQLSWVSGITTFSTNSSQLYYSADSGSNFLSLTGSGLSLKTSGTATIQVDGSNGLEYAFDYSPNYTNRSLVDKQYVDTLVNAVTTESTTAGNGLTMNGTVVELGGTLNQYTVIDADGNTFRVKNTPDFYIGGGEIGTNTQSIYSISEILYLASNDSHLIELDGSIGEFRIKAGNQNFSAILDNSSMTADRTITFQNASGTVAYLDDIVAGNTFGSNGITRIGNTFELGGILNKNTNIDVNNKLFTIEGTAGIKYYADYSAHYTNRSLVDKGYVDGLVTQAIQGLNVKTPVRVATSSNITLSGLQTIDGVTLVAGDRVLVKDQTNAQENGVYVASASTWVRSADFDANPSESEIINAFFFVSEGATYSDTGWVLTTNSPIVIDTTNLTFAQFSAAGVTQAGAGLLKTGNILSVETGNGIEIVGNNVSVNTNSSSGLTFQGTDLVVNAQHVSTTATNSAVVKIADDTNSLFIDFSSYQSNVVVLSNTSNNVSGSIGYAGTSINLSGVTLKGEPRLHVNGILYKIGFNATPSNNLAFFSPDGTTVRASIATIQNGDKIYWNPLFANSFDLDTTDSIELVYNTQL
jgi:mannitol/fructose-specific phosphotransferase system IIA component